ncbi:MAG TPA: hypothetical protein EYP04_03940 [Anaerolineae bacterium]|nr:hypothetical protein [Anaerolineae bacterium]
MKVGVLARAQLNAARWWRATEWDVKHLIATGPTGDDSGSILAIGNCCHPKANVGGGITGGIDRDIVRAVLLHSSRDMEFQRLTVEGQALGLGQRVCIKRCFLVAEGGIGRAGSPHQISCGEVCKRRRQVGAYGRERGSDGCQVVVGDSLSPHGLDQIRATNMLAQVAHKDPVPIPMQVVGGNPGGRQAKARLVEVVLQVSYAVVHVVVDFVFHPHGYRLIEPVGRLHAVIAKLEGVVEFMGGCYLNVL